MAYPATSLVKLKGKYYVNCTIPPELRCCFSNRKQSRLSTGTSDHKLAQIRQFELTRKLYAQFDEAQAELKRQRLGQLEYLLGGEVPEDTTLDVLSQAVALMGQRASHDLEEALAVEAEAKEAARAVEQLAKVDSKLTIEGLARVFLEAKPAPYTQKKTAKEAETALDEYCAFIGPTKDVASLKQVDAYRYAEALAETKSQKTIAKKIGYVRKCLDWAVRRGYLDSNPFRDLSLSSYGTKKVSYVPFTKQELHDLFALDMKKHEQALLAILATTGMRLDEAALLKWEDVKQEDGVRFLDLTDRQGTIKNIGSARKVPLPDAAWKIVLNYRLMEQVSRKTKGAPSGRMFPQFKVNADGKAQGPASKALMALVRKITSDERKVVHSLRGTLKDMLRDAGVSKEVNDFITGHSHGDVAGSYGVGPSLRVRYDALQRCDFRFIS